MRYIRATINLPGNYFKTQNVNDMENAEITATRVSISLHLQDLNSHSLQCDSVHFNGNEGFSPTKVIRIYNGLT